jgi:hypothetical protein
VELYDNAVYQIFAEATVSPNSDDSKDEAYKAYVARWEAHEVEEADRRRQEGKIAIWLGRAEDDAPTFSHDHQADLHSVLGALRQEGIELEAPFLAVDAADAVSGYTGQLIISLAQIAAPVLTGALVAWLKGRPGRKVRLQFHPDGKLKSIEAQTPEQVLELMRAARQEAESQAPKKKTK